MFKNILAFLAIIFSAVAGAAQNSPPASQSGPAARIGEKIDRGLSQVGSELSQAWAEVRKSVEKMGVQGRVYGRLHWDKALECANVEINVRDGQVVVLTGTVASSAAKLRAEQLANDTVGVSTVVNELSIAAPK